MFKNKQIEVTIMEGFDIGLWVNPPMYLLDEASDPAKRISVFSQLILSWTIGGQEYYGYKFPEKPCVEAILALPNDAVKLLFNTAMDALKEYSEKN